jgi:protein-disulfide isomerase
MSTEEKAPAADESPSRGHDEGGAGMNTGVAIIGFIVCFVAGAGLMWGYDAHHGGGSKDIAADSGGAWSDDDAPVAVDNKDPMWGSRSAPVTMVIFSDYQCPFCSRVEPTVQQVKDTYGPDKVRIIWKNNPLPFHPNAKPAAEAAEGVFELAGNDAFWKFHDTAFKNQSALGPDSYTKWAQDSGVKDMAKFKAGLDAHTFAAKVDKDLAEGKTVGVNGTPAFFINGVSLSGAQPFDKFKAVIDQELQKAQAKIASGTPKNKIYVTMAQENKTNAPAADAQKPQEQPKDDTTTVFKVPVGDSPMTWSKAPLVTMIEFSDFQCPFCKRVEDSLNKIHDKYGDKVGLVWKNEPLPFHNRAEPAAEVAMEALSEKGVKGFWDVHDKLFASQPKLEDADLAQVAKDAGLDAKKVDDAIKNHTWKKQIDADNAVATQFAANGTPHFFINGRRLVGAQPPDAFMKIIDDEVTKAQGLLAKGTKQKDLYDTLTKDGKTSGAAAGGAAGGAAAAADEKKPMPSIVGAPWKGNKNAKVTVVEFSDFQCPFCSRVEPTVAQVMKDYGDKIKFVWRNLPLPMHPDAPLAAQAAMEAYKQKGSDGFWKMHDAIYTNQHAPDGIKRPALENYAQQQGLDMDKFKASLDSQSHKAEVDADAKMAADEGIQGTPAFIINGYFVNGAQPYDKFKATLDKAISEAK